MSTQCSELGCHDESLSKGLCNKHYIQTWRATQFCSVQSCQSKKHSAGLCKKHNREFNGDAGYREPIEGSEEAKAYYEGLWSFVQKELRLKK